MIQTIYLGSSCISDLNRRSYEDSIQITFLITFLTIITCENKLKVIDSIVPQAVLKFFKTKYPDIPKVELEKAYMKQILKLAILKRKPDLQGMTGLLMKKDED